MKLHYLLGIALATATAVVACGDSSTDTLAGSDGNGRTNTNPGDQASSSSSSSSSSGAAGSSSSSSGAASGSSTSGGPGSVVTNSPTGLAYFTANVFPILNSKCGSCHIAGPGTIWFNADAGKAYTQLFQVGYVVQNSRIVVKPAHGGITTNTLDNASDDIYNTWVAMELKDGGTKAPPNVLASLGSCFDKTKFDAMQLGQWKTTQRTNNNNTNNVTPWNENANNCTGCNQAQCSTCHSADAATNFNNAVGNNIVEGDNKSDAQTFASSKLTDPAYITKYFGVSPDGKPVASGAILAKSTATQQDKAYTHPMFTLTTAQQTAMTDFVNDVITKFAAGQCTAPAPPTP